MRTGHPDEDTTVEQAQVTSCDGQLAVEDEDLDGVAYPFDPGQIDITDSKIAVYNLVEKLKCGDIDIMPDFQRHPDLWRPNQQSRLIESLLLGIPLQTLYFDAEIALVDDPLIGRTQRQVWHVVDGLQRLSSIRSFVIGKGGDAQKPLKLKGLEYLLPLEGLTFTELSPVLQRKILETTIPFYLIRPTTPEAIKFNIFKRLNTGGLPLNQQEIRHALLHGPGIEFICKLAKDEPFKTATRHVIPSRRMLDREFVTRFCAFYLMDPAESYRSMEVFLNDAVRLLNKADEAKKAEVRAAFDESMTLIHSLLGDRSFGRYLAKDGRWNPKINKAVYDALSVGVAKLTPDDRRKLAGSEGFADAYRQLFVDFEQGAFAESVMTSTGNRAKVMQRHEIMHRFLAAFLEKVG